MEGIHLGNTARGPLGKAGPRGPLVFLGKGKEEEDEATRSSASISLQGRFFFNVCLRGVYVSVLENHVPVIPTIAVGVCVGGVCLCVCGPKRTKRSKPNWK